MHKKKKKEKKKSFWDWTKKKPFVGIRLWFINLSCYFDSPPQDELN